jgi:hypothetical protein
MDVARHLTSLNLSETAVMAISVPEARRLFAPIRFAHGLANGAVRLLSDPSANVKLSHSETDRVAAYGLNLVPSDSYGAYTVHYSHVLSGDLTHASWVMLNIKANTCRFASPGCRAACLATSGQAGLEMHSGKDRIYRARRAKLAFLLAHPLHFLRLLVAEIDDLRTRAHRELRKLNLSTRGWKVSLRLNVLSDLPWETVAPWLLLRARKAGLVAYDYTAWPTAKRDRSAATSVGLYLVDSVKETHSDAQIASMERPVVVVNISRSKSLPTTWRGRPAHDADRSDARFMDPSGSVSLLRYKHVATCTAADALASGFVKSAS